MLFTMGSMSHDRTTAGQESKSPLTLAAAGLAAALSRVSYDRAIVGVFGKPRSLNTFGHVSTTAAPV